MTSIVDVSTYNAEFFASWLKKKRHQRNLTVTGLAQIARVSKQYISMLERAPQHMLTGKPVQPSLDKVERLAAALDADFDEARAAAGYELMPESDGFDSEGLFSGINKLPPDKRRLAERQIRAIIDSLSEKDFDFDYIDETKR